MTKNINWIAIGLLCLLAGTPSGAEEKQRAQQKTLSDKISTTDLNVCGVNQYFKGDEDFQKSTFYSLYRPDDLKREKLVATMEVKDGNGLLERIKRMTLTEAESLWGSSKEGQGERGERVGISDPEWRFFELVGIAYQSTKPQLDRRPKFFYIFSKNLLSFSLPSTTEAATIFVSGSQILKHQEGPNCLLSVFSRVSPGFVAISGKNNCKASIHHQILNPFWQRLKHRLVLALGHNELKSFF